MKTFVYLGKSNLCKESVTYQYVRVKRRMFIRGICRLEMEVEEQKFV